MTTHEEPMQTKPQTRVTKPVEPVKKKSSLGGLLIVGLIVAVVLAVGIVEGIRSRTHAESTLEQTTQADATPFVSVVLPTSGSAGQEIQLPGNTQAFTDTPIYARTSGYLKKWYFDIGANVKQASSGRNVYPVLLATEQSSQLQVPFEVAPGTLLLAVQRDGGLLWMAPLNVKEAAPAIFVDADGTPMIQDASSGLVIDAGTPLRDPSYPRH